MSAWLLRLLLQCGFSRAVNSPNFLSTSTHHNRLLSQLLIFFAQHLLSIALNCWQTFKFIRIRFLRNKFWTQKIKYYSLFVSIVVIVMVMLFVWNEMNWTKWRDLHTFWTVSVEWVCVRCPLASNAVVHNQIVFLFGSVWIQTFGRGYMYAASASVWLGVECTLCVVYTEFVVGRWA